MSLNDLACAPGQIIPDGRQERIKIATEAEFMTAIPKTIFVGFSTNHKRNSAIADKTRHAFTVTLKPGLGVSEGHWKCHHSIQRMRLPIDVQ